MLVEFSLNKIIAEIIKTKAPIAISNGYATSLAEFKIKGIKSIASYGGKNASLFSTVNKAIIVANENVI